MQVDDNMVNRRVATSMLARYGANVVAVNGGAEALKALSSQDPEEAYDLVLMDIQMPEVGFMILRCHLKSCLTTVENMVVGLVGPFFPLWPEGRDHEILGPLKLIRSLYHGKLKLTWVWSHAFLCIANT